MDGLNQRDVTQAKETHHFQSVTLCLEVTSFWYLSVHPSILDFYAVRPLLFSVVKAGQQLLQ